MKTFIKLPLFCIAYPGIAEYTDYKIQVSDFFAMNKWQLINFVETKKIG